MKEDSTVGRGEGSVLHVTAVCAVAALGGLLFGYDTAVIAGAIGFLKEHFGLDAAMTGWAASSALVGCILGVAIAGKLSDRFGRKPALVLAALFFLICAIFTAIPPNFTVFVIFRIVGGVGVGIASMVSPMYIAEVSPARIRGRLVSVNQFAIVSGMLIVYFVNYYISLQGDHVWNVESGWRWMFGSGAVPSVLFLLLVLLVPESPRFLVEQGKRQKAERILAKLVGPTQAEREMRAIDEVLEEEPASVGQLFQPRLRMLLFLGVLLAALQQVTGINVFLYYAPEIFKQLGEGSDVAMMQTIVVGAVNLLFTVLAIWSVDRVGRKPLMMIGSAGMGLCLVAMGMAAQAGLVAGWVLAFVLGYIACFALSVGPVTWVILSEIYPTRIRGRALSIATFFLWGANFIVSQTFPMMDESQWLVRHFNHAFPFYLYAGFCVVLLLVVWRMLPETKGRSLEEIEREWLSRSR